MRDEDSSEASEQLECEMWQKINRSITSLATRSDSFSFRIRTARLIVSWASDFMILVNPHKHANASEHYAVSKERSL